MTPDQRTRMAAVYDRLAEATIRDADPDNWSGRTQLLCEMDKETRGNAAWCRKVAVQTLAALGRVQAILGGDIQPPDDPEAEIRRAEAAASAALNRALNRESA